MALQRPFGEVPAAAAQDTRRGVLQLADPCPRGVSDALRLRPAHCNRAPLLDEALGEAANALAKVRELGLQLSHGRALKEIRDSNAESREQHLYVTVDSIADVPSLLGLDGGAERLRRDQWDPAWGRIRSSCAKSARSPGWGRGVPRLQSKSARFLRHRPPGRSRADGKESGRATVTNGTQTETRGAAPAPAYLTGAPSDEGTGWVLFAGIMFMVSSMLNIIWGIAAVSNAHFFVGNASYILSDLNTWGWVAIGFGALEALATLSIWRGGVFGRWFGIAIAGLAIVAAMMSIPAYPFWSLVLVAIYVMVIYGLAAYGGRPELMR